MKAKTLVATLVGVLSFAAMAGELDNTPSIARPAGVEAAPIGGVLVKKNEAGVIVEAYKVPMKVTEENQAQALAEITSNPANKITLNELPAAKSELDQSSSAAASWYVGIGWGGGYGYGIGYGYGWGGYYGGYCGYGYGYGYGGCGYGGYWGGYYPYYRPYGGCWGWYY